MNAPRLCRVRFALSVVVALTACLDVSAQRMHRPMPMGMPMPGMGMGRGSMPLVQPMPMFQPIPRITTGGSFNMFGTISAPSRAAVSPVNVGLPVNSPLQFAAGTGFPIYGNSFGNSAGFGGVGANAALGTGLVNPYAGALGGGGYGLSMNPYASGGYGSSGYGGYGSGGYSQDPVGDYLRGTGSLITAEGKSAVDVQQAGILKEKNKQASVETGRKEFDEKSYERSHKPTAEDDRQRSLSVELKRSLNDPPAAEISSGQALNNILMDLAKIERTRGLPEHSPSLDRDTLRRVNVTKGAGNAGLLKLDGRLTWPLALQGDRFRTDREMVSSLAPEAVFQALEGRVDGGTLKQLTVSAQHMREILSAGVQDMTVGQYVEARRFIGFLDEGLKSLSRPDAGDYFNSKYTAQGADVRELVKHLSAHGLRFASAVPGDEPAYASLYRAMVRMHGDAQGPVADRR